LALRELQVLQWVQVDSVQALHWVQVDSVGSVDSARSVVTHQQNDLHRRQDGRTHLLDNTVQKQ
jgi:hypothetical protein